MATTVPTEKTKLQNNSTDNSLSKTVEEFVVLQTNAIEILQALNSAVESDQDIVTIEIKDSSGNKVPYKIFSQSYIKHSIERIDATLQKMMGLNTDAYIRMPDGSFKKVFTYNLHQEPDDIKDIVVPSKFDIDDNIFLENMMSPAMYVKFNLDGKIPKDSKKVKTNRVLIKIESDDDIKYFDDTFNNKSEIKYDDLIAELTTKEMIYKEDIQINNLPESRLQFTGTFNIIKKLNEPRLTEAISRESGQGIPITSQISQNITTKNIKRYEFESLKYYDNINQLSVSLKVGDTLQVKESVYEVIDVNSSTNLVGLLLKSGLDNVPLLDPDNVRIFSVSWTPLSVNINVNVNEYEVIFLKSIDPTTNIEANNWSNGVGFKSNDLIFNGTETQLKDYYGLNVIDYGRAIFNSARDGKISVFDGVKPNKVVLDAKNFKVVEINKHILNTPKLKEVEKQASAKISLGSELSNIDAAIAAKRELINKKAFSNKGEEEKHINELSSLMDERVGKSNLYNSLVSELAVASKNEPGLKNDPKYRIRGFFEIPATSVTSTGHSQEIVKFDVRYKYINADSETSSADQFPMVTSESQIKNGTISPWNLLKTKSRERVWDDANGIYIWSIEDISNPEVININQIDIPITKGEKVEISVRSVAEAGFPDKPLVSDWSESVIIEFPLSDAEKSSAVLALEAAENEEYLNRFNETLASLGVPEHIKKSLFLGGEYFAHSSDSILSGQYDDAGNQLSEFELIKRLIARIDVLEAKILEVKGVLDVYVFDIKNNKKFKVNQNSTISLFAGFYDNDISELAQSEQNGAIITKNYQLLIENSKGNPIELISRIPGGFGERLPSSELNEINDQDYNKKLRYDLVPIVQKSIATNETKNGVKISPDGFMSEQLLSQFVYLRYTDVGLNKTLYVNPNDNDRAIGLGADDVSSDQDIWSYTFNLDHSLAGFGHYSSLCLSTDYPEFEELYNLVTNEGVPTSSASAVKAAIQTPKTSDTVCMTSALRHSACFNLHADDPDGVKQLSYKLFEFASIGNNEDFYKYPDKFGFSKIDRYTIGENSVGSYLVVGLNTLNQLQVDGTDFNAKKELVSDTDGIRLDFSFQYRMRDYKGFANGWSSSYNEPPNMHYKKRIGIDIYVKNETPFSFDIEVDAKLKQTTANERSTEHESAPSIVYMPQHKIQKQDIFKIL